jgi:hypothetical protein
LYQTTFAKKVMGNAMVKKKKPRIRVASQLVQFTEQMVIVAFDSSSNERNAKWVEAK